MKISAINNVYSKPFAFKQNQIQKDTTDLSKYYVNTNKIRLSDMTNEEIEEKILKEVYDASCSNMRSIFSYKETNPIKILNNILLNADDTQMLSDERLNQLYSIARKLSNEISLSGAKNILNR